MKAFGSITGVFWVTCLGACTLFAFFAAIGAISPGEVRWLTGAMAGLAAFSAVHFIRVRHALGDHHHDDLARAVHAMREHRGF